MLLKILKRYLINFNIVGKNNKIIWNRGSEKKNKNIHFKTRRFKLNIVGHNNKIILSGKINKKELNQLLSGLTLNIEGSNNIVKIEYPMKFENSLIDIKNDNNIFSIKKSIYPVRQATFYIEGDNEVIIGKDSQLDNRGLYVVLNGNYKKRHKLIMGDNVYIAKDTLIRTSDGHTLIDLNTNTPLSEPEDIIIGNNVWITSKCTILKGTELPNNCIVGACSLVNKKFTQENILIAGTPAKIIKNNVTWSALAYGKYMRSLEIKEKNNEIN